MNRKLTREEALRLHREMWQDMQSELGDTPYYDERLMFKEKWVEEHFPNEHVNSNCFLCEYAQSVTCVQQWSEILSKINSNANWKEVRYEVSEMQR